MAIFKVVMAGGKSGQIPPYLELAMSTKKSIPRFVCARKIVAGGVTG